MPIQHSTQSNNLLDVLEKILDKGVVIAGDIKIALADVDLLTIKIRLLVASVDKAREIGMDWWESDPYYSSKGRLAEQERAQLLERVNRLEQLVETKAIPQEVEEKALLEPIVENKEEVIKIEEDKESVNQAKTTDSSNNAKEKESRNKKNEKKKNPGNNN